jgi:hypothetical protein
LATDEAQWDAALKGALFRSFLLWYEHKFGRRQIAELCRGLPDQVRAALDPDREGLGILANEWYPAALAHALLDAMERLHGREAMPGMLREGCEQMAADLFRGVYRFLLQLVGSPDLYAKHIQKAWRSLHSSGDREVILKDPGVAESTIRDWRGHHRWLCLLTHETTRRAFMAMGFQAVQIEQTQCVANGDPLCRATIRYLKA